MSTQTQTEVAITALPDKPSPFLTLKIRLMGWDRAQFEALRQFYGVSDKKLAAAAIRHFLDAVKTGLPKVEVH